MVPKSDHLANPRFDKKPSAQVNLAGHDGVQRVVGHEAADALAQGADHVD